MEGDNVGLLVNWENLVHQVDQVPKDQEEKMDQRDLWENLVNQVHKVFQVLLENQVLLDLQVHLGPLVKARLLPSLLVEVKACLDLLEPMDPWVPRDLLVSVELVEHVVQKEVLECQEYLEVQVVQVDQDHLVKVVLLESLVKMENPDVNIARTILEKSVLLS